MRDWKRNPKARSSTVAAYLKPTYEGLKDDTTAEDDVVSYIFKAYLWGIESADELYEPYDFVTI